MKRTEHLLLSLAAIRGRNGCERGGKIGACFDEGRTDFGHAGDPRTKACGACIADRALTDDKRLREVDRDLRWHLLLFGGLLAMTVVGFFLMKQAFFK